VHNTGAYGFIFLGDISGEAKITNNLFYNPMSLGVDAADEQRFAEIKNISELGSDGLPVYPLIIEQPNTLYNTKYTMHNNVVTYDATVKNYMTTNKAKPAPALAPRLAAKVTGNNPFVDADVTLKNIPNVMIEVMNWYRPLAVAVLAGGMITTTTVDMDRRNADYWLTSFDASYNTTNPAFLGSDGKPVGAPWKSTVTVENPWKERLIEPTDGFVNEIIRADTLAGGVRAHTAYVFRRGQKYYVNGQIENRGFAMLLKAEAGTGKLPIISNWPDANGVLGRIVDALDDTYIQNLYLDGMGPNLTTLEPDPLYRMNGQLLRAAAAGKVLVIEGSILSNVGQTIIRSNSGARKVALYNTTIANAGQLSADNLGNGRIIDFRNGITDTVIFKNCTMVNTYDRIIRHYGAAANSETAYIKYFEMDHNTIVHNTGAYGFIFLGDISGEAKITNNLFYNPMSLGVDAADEQRFAEIKN
ncbi:MAG: hypothetical protein Q8T08_25415, partial [Ignavibacteria bacterium]|nr:hypothetical protein [Ignavibacteria bacterium]